MNEDEIKAISEMIEKVAIKNKNDELEEARHVIITNFHKQDSTSIMLCAINLNFALGAMSAYKMADFALIRAATLKYTSLSAKLEE